MKKQGEPIAAVCAVATLIVLRFTVKRMVKKYTDASIKL